jgi:hypothetical protein
MNLFERELSDLRAQRVRARRNIEKAWWLVSDHIDRRRFVESQVRFLNGSERRLQELCLLLGRPLPGKPVRLR